MDYYCFGEYDSLTDAFDNLPQDTFGTFYRFENYGSTVMVIEYELIKETPCGYWILDKAREKNRWVSKTAKKRYAYPTVNQALWSFYKRKEKQISILTGKLETAKIAAKRAAARLKELKNAEA